MEFAGEPAIDAGVDITSINRVASKIVRSSGGGYFATDIVFFVFFVFLVFAATTAARSRAYAGACPGAAARA